MLTNGSRWDTFSPPQWSMMSPPLTPEFYRKEASLMHLPRIAFLLVATVTLLMVACRSTTPDPTSDPEYTAAVAEYTAAVQEFQAQANP